MIFGCNKLAQMRTLIISIIIINSCSVWCYLGMALTLTDILGWKWCWKFLLSETSSYDSHSVSSERMVINWLHLLWSACVKTALETCLLKVQIWFLFVRVEQLRFSRINNPGFNEQIFRIPWPHSYLKFSISASSKRYIPLSKAIHTDGHAYRHLCNLKYL